MPEQKIKCLFFDCGNVLVAFDIGIVCRELAVFSPLSPDRIFSAIYGQGLLFGGSLHHQLETGQIGIPEFFHQAKKAIQANSGLTMEKFQEIANGIFKENTAIKKILGHVKQNFKLSILSNTNELNWNYLQNFSVIKDNFENSDIFLSFKIGSKKPDPAIFRTVLEKCAFQPSEILFIDDEPRNVEGFAKFGVRGIKYNCRTDSLEKLNADLANLGIL
jgi:putative hydrolase of the HAD superfamily